VLVDAAEVLRVLAVLEAADVRAGLTGGWGIDALLRRQTRVHGDVDIGVAAEAVDSAIDALRGIGYATTVDQRPARLVLVSDKGQVDLHPIVWGPTGTGIQTGFDGETFEYPPGSVDAEGMIAGQLVRCATPSLQLTFHERYVPRDHDRADMAALADQFGLQLPRAYRD
jgi:lincosamide nucleotidyltransferase A/C/D/E